ncbi:2-methylcitrate dehydratase [Phytohabitans suffuscus]|uniref:2-methylcitrate dehydratase n=1 Tax=Phytohabitans suffuscus TaxID=624315 RepID=A0A6F8Z1K7_9ACTN|nr:MmgE/PrpD family protein [Phytohabitans suffuscus]BCB92058.1 2-methylcitrate dehydratase [Phytohabitans suffuscus]
MTGPAATASARLVAWAGRLRLADVPAPVRRSTALHILDTIGCGLAASASGVATAARDLVRDRAAAGDCSLIGGHRRVAAAPAAFANAMLCHGLDYDDTHRGASAHISAVVVPAAVAAAEAHARSGADLLRAVVAATEATARIGLSAPGRFQARGFHPTSVCGVFGAALAAAGLEALPPGRTVHALGVAGSMAAGILECLDDGSEAKPVNAAVAARNGIEAVELARYGATGPRRVLEGRFGVVAAFAGGSGEALAAAVDTLGTVWETARIAPKPYPVCHLMHAAVDAAAAALDASGAAPDRVAEIVVGVPPAAVPIVLEPLAEKRVARTAYHVKFSLPVALAIRLLRGRLDHAAIEDALGDPAVHALARRVRYEVAEFPTARDAFPGRAEVVLAGGRRFPAEVPVQRGAPAHPMTDRQVLEKFRGNASGALPAARSRELEERILAIEREPDVRDVFALLSPGS